MTSQPVWPLIYKPTFNASTASRPLVLAMLSIAACTSRGVLPPNTPSQTLHAEALKAVEGRPQEASIELIQTYILLGLRQSGAGMKISAYAFAGRASRMTLELGLHLMPVGSSRETVGSNFTSGTLKRGGRGRRCRFTSRGE